MPSRSYYMLIASLPNMPADFDVERPPITRDRLNERLRLLHEVDAAIIDQVAGFLAWDRQPLDRSDAEICERYDQLMRTIRNPLVRQLVDTRMTIRTIVSAVRRRRAELGPPLGVGIWVDHLRRNWAHADFRLSSRFPWIAEFERLLDRHAPMETQKLLFSVVWDTWSRLAEGYTFSFEAVILYLARWEIVDRWSSSDAAVGQQRFEHLITETLGEYAQLY